MSDGKAADADEFEIPSGAPIRVSDWLGLPVIWIVVIPLLVWAGQRSSVSEYLDVVGALAVVAALVQAVFGWRAWVLWTEDSLARFRWSSTATFACLGLLTVFFVLPITILFFAASGRRAVRDGGARMATVYSLLSQRGWGRLTAIATMVTVVTMLARPIAFAFGPGTTAVAIVLSIAAPVIAGIAYGMRPDDHRFF